ncbi:MAG: MFS transporter [Clostridia bacterium]|nr:MFS transporter [Clostridia bacterium]
MRLKLSRQHIVLVSAMVLIAAIVFGLANNLQSLFIVPVTEELGTTRGAYSLYSIFQNIFAIISNMIFVVVTRKFGIRKTAAVFIMLQAMAYVGYSRMHTLIPYYIGGAIYGLSESFVYAAGTSRITSNWFHSHYGLVFGIIMAATGVGGSIYTIVLTAIMDRSDWRVTFMFAAATMVVAALLMFFVVRETPEERNVQPYRDADKPEAKKKVKDPSKRLDIPTATVRKQPFLYMILGSNVLVCMCVGSSYYALNPHLRQIGFSSGYAAACFSVVLAALAIWKILLGIVADKAGAVKVIAFCMFSEVVLGVLAAQVRLPALVMVIAVLQGSSSCMSGFLQPLLIADLFAGESHGAVLSMLLTAMCFGRMAGSPFANFLYDITGSYVLPLYLCALIAAIGLGLYAAGIAGYNRYRNKLIASN